MVLRSLPLPVSLLFLLLIPAPLLAQSITPANDGTGTQVLQEGNSLQGGRGDRYTITGGTRSRENLFHSFERLGLSTDEIATFLAQPGIENILGRVIGGDASLIDGLLQVQGGNANLYLMNPAGIVFGPNARLDLSGSFYATTATGIGFGEHWFNAIGDNTYEDLVGNPDSFAFSLADGGAIANLADLTVNPGESLALLGGTVTNTGTLTAPAGSITVAAVPGEHRVRLSQTGSLLSLELEAANGTWDGALNPLNLTPLSLPQLLTGGTLATASEIAVNPDGTVQLAGTNVPVQDGTALVSGTLDTSGTAAAEITVVGDRIALLQANLDASGTNGGGHIRIGGDYRGEGTIFNASQTFVDPTTQINASSTRNGNGGRVILWADEQTQFYGAIAARGGSNSGNGGFVEVSGANTLNFQGIVDTSAANGTTGTLLLDPTNITIVAGTGPIPSGLGSGDGVWSGNEDPGDQTIGANTVLSLLGSNDLILEATNNINVNAALDHNLSSSGSVERTLTLRAGNSIILAAGAAITNTGGDFNPLNVVMQADQDGNGTGAITLNDRIFVLGSITLRAANDIRVAGLTSGDSLVNEGSLSITSTNGSINTVGGDLVVGGSSFSGPMRLSASGDIITGDIELSATEPGELSLVSRNGRIDTTAGTIDGGSGVSLSAASDLATGNLAAGGAVNLVSQNGAITTGNLANEGSSFTLTAANDISVGTMGASSSFPSTEGEPITIRSTNGRVQVGEIAAEGLIRGRDVTISAANDITTGSINTSALSSGSDDIRAGNVALTAGGSIEVDSIRAEAENQGTGGTVRITAGQFFRATDTLDDGVNSIFTGGASANGAITIRHGGNGNTPFVIGESFGSNGSLGTITDGVTAFTVGESIPGSETRGNLQIITGSPPPPPDPLDPPNCVVDCNGNGPVENTFEFPEVVEPQDLLLALAEQTGIPPALIYVSFVSPQITVSSDLAQREAIASQQFASFLEQDNPTDPPLLTVQPADTDELELLLVLPNGDPVRHRVPGVTRSMVTQVRRQLLTEVTAPNRLRSNRYLAPAQQLYQWMIAPLEADLEAQGIENLAFIMDTGLRSLPMSVLHDGEQFLIERYSIGLMPSVSLTDTRYRDLRNVPILAMGASQFETLQPLPAVPTELVTVASVVPNSVTYLNQDFTQTNLLKSREERPYSIVHLATHAEFLPGELDNSYIQFSDRRLSLDELRNLQLNQPPVELLVLSACKTALGDEQAELGFGGLAVQTGVRSVLASLWYVSDTGTLGFMSEFYRQLQVVPIRAEALRQTQLAMLRGELQLQDDQLITTRGATVTLPPDLVDNSLDLTHPYFWASFTMIGSPW